MKKAWMALLGAGCMAAWAVAGEARAPAGLSGAGAPTNRPVTVLPAALVPPPLPGAGQGDILRGVLSRFPEQDPEHLALLMNALFPEEMLEFRELSRQHPERAVEVAARVAMEALRLEGVRRRDPGQYDKALEQRRLERQALEQAAAWRRSRGAQREEHLAGLRQALSGAFEVKQQIMMAQVAGLEQELKALKELVEKRQAGRSEILERRLRELTGGGDGLEW